MAKSRTKVNADRSRQAKKSSIHIVDTVLLQQKKTSKWMTKFDPNPFKVVRIKGTMITAVRNEKYVTRNASLYKTLIVDSFVDKGGDEYEDEDEDISDVSSEDDTPAVQNEDTSQNNLNPTRRYPVRERRPLQRYIEHC